MRRLWAAGVLILAAACSHKEPPPERMITPGARVIYSSGTGDAVWTTCDRGNLLYFTARSPQIIVVPAGCPSGSP